MYQEERQISTTKVAAQVLWGLVVALMVAGWLVVILGDHHVGFLLALTSCATSAAAATMQIKDYSRGICGVVRDSRELMADVRSLSAVRHSAD